MFLIKLLGRIYLFIFLGIARIVLQGEKHFFGAFDRALRGNSRCILAFRHPNGGEPQVLTWFIMFRLENLAKKAGFSFAKRPHALFVYGYDVLRWGGWVARFIMPGLGAMPVHPTKLDSLGMSRIFRAIKEGVYPLAIAPEGRITHNTEQVFSLEQGAIRIGFHAADQLRKEEKPYPVEILPVSIHLRYGIWGKMCLARLMKRLDRATGFRDRYKKEGEPPFTVRLRNCRDYLIAENELRYGIPVDEKRSIPERTEGIVAAALDKAEKILGIHIVKDEIITRLNHARQVCWDRIYLPERKTMEGLSQVKRSHLDLRAGEAWYAGRHIDLMNFLWYFRSPLPEEDTPLHLKIEYAQNLWIFAHRTMGGSYVAQNFNIFPRRVIIQAGEPINLTDKLPGYSQGRKTAIQSAMNDLLKAYMDCIEEVNKTD
ncbi:MAG: acyltransferase [Treponema sp.]|jgi:1-acyl-sn-glycerol-3-phosphate acyltransferase|nr:acyltransferase [Treponema sp.]